MIGFTASKLSKSGLMAVAAVALFATGASSFAEQSLDATSCVKPDTPVFGRLLQTWSLRRPRAIYNSNPRYVALCIRDFLPDAGTSVRIGVSRKLFVRRFVRLFERIEVASRVLAGR